MQISRKLASKVMEYLNIFAGIALTGPRQSGKSTLLQTILPEYEYVNFDDEDTRTLFYDDPKGFMERYPNKVIFDEAQKVPEIFERVKIEIDKDPQNKGRFVLSGSSQFLMFRNITESLAGRIGLLELLPLNYEEMPEALRKASIFRGSYPEPVTQNFQYNEIWYSAYLQTYLEKDVRDLLKINNLRGFRRFINLLAAQTSNTLNMSTLGNDLGVSSSTIKNWISVLEASYIIFLLPPYYNNIGKRIIKSPKLYFWDTGLAAHLTKITSQDLYEHGPMAGQLFENYVIAEVAKKERLKTSPSELYYLRTGHGLEIDLIIDKGLKQNFIEIKKSLSFKPKMLSNLKTLSTQDSSLYLIYQGESYPNNGKVNIINYADYIKQLT